MPGLIENAGGVKNPSKYGGVGMGGRQFTGVVTQKSPYRDGAVAYLVGKFYGGSRIDTIVDGMNREITQALTDKRAPGSSVYNSNTFPPCQSMDVWKYIQNNAEVVKVLYDGAGATTVESITGTQRDTSGGNEFITVFFTGTDVIALGTPVGFAKLTSATFLNGTTKNVYASSAGQATFYLGTGTLASGVIADTGTASFGTPGDIFDATAGQKSTLLTKSAAAGPARFLSVNTELFISDGVDQQKIVAGSKNWQPSQSINPGQLINTNGNPGFIQMALGGMVIPVIATAADGTNVYIYVDPQQIPLNFPNLLNANIAFSGFTNATFLNATTVPIAEIVSTTLGIFAIANTASAYDYQAEPTGASGTTGDGTTDTTAPTFSTTEFTIVQDAGQQWKCYGPSLEGWGLATPTSAPVITALNGTSFWQPNLVTNGNAVLDPNGNIQLVFSAPGGVTGRVYPNFTATVSAPGVYAATMDGTVQWRNMGPIGAWAAQTFYAGNSGGGFPSSPFNVIVDSNGNLQWAVSTTSETGTTEPTWATSMGSNTTDGGTTWQNIGPGIIISTATLTFGYSTHAVDGSVSTSSGTSQIQGGILGIAPISPGLPTQDFWSLSGTIPNDTQIDQVWLWRTAQGEPTLILEDQIPSDGLLGAGFTYNDPGIPDTSVNGGGSLNALIPVPDNNDPPQSNMTAPVYHLQRGWGIVGNTVVYSGGPDTVTGNGLTAWPPLNEIPFPAQPIKLDPVTVQNGGLIVRTTDGVYIILGTGTLTNPFYTTSYYPSVSVSSYTACGQYNNALFQEESNGKVSTLAIEYPFNPQTGYVEVGFPIGDQFPATNFGGVTATFNPATSYLSWCLANSADSGMYVADGAGHWWRMSLINPPESGILWSPLRTIQGGSSAVQSVEVSPGVTRLLIAPASSGPILQRDTTGAVWNDNGTPYDAWDAKGVTLLCQTGQWADVAHISAKSRLLGARPTVSVLLNEIAALPAANGAPYSVLTDYTQDPARGKKSRSVFSDRYELLQNGVETEGDCILVKFDYGDQEQGDELLDWQIYASVHDEREEAVSK